MEFTMRTSLDIFLELWTWSLLTIEQPANPSYKDEDVLDFELTLDNNVCANLESLHNCFTIHFKKFSNATANLEADIYQVNNFF